jgi:hypothetical protein
MAMVLAGCGKDRPGPPDSVGIFRIEPIDGKDVVHFNIWDKDTRNVGADGVVEVRVIEWFFDKPDREVCRHRWEITAAGTAKQPVYLTGLECPWAGDTMRAELTLTLPDGKVLRDNLDPVILAVEAKTPPAPRPIDAGVDAAPAADVTPYLALLGKVAAATAAPRDGTSHCQGALSAGLDPRTPWWLVERDQLGALLGTGPEPPPAFAWVSTPNFLSVDGLARSLGKRPAVLLVATPIERRMPIYTKAAEGNQKGEFAGGVYEATLFAVDHATGEIGCHIRLSVRSSSQVEGPDEVEGDFKERFGEALYQARGRLSDPLWHDDDPLPGDFR